MNRYSIAKEAAKVSNFQDHTGYRFKPTGSVGEVLRYINVCLEHKKTFIADNIPENVLLSGIFSFCKKEDIPILVKANEVLKLLIAYSYNKVYDIDSFPKHLTYLINLNCTEIPSWSKPKLVIIYY